VVNPGSRRGSRFGQAVRALITEANVGCDLLETTAPGHAARAVASLEPGIDAVFVLGGDGTVMEVVGALANTGIPVGVLPGGTGNLVAGALRIPLDVLRAARELLAGEVRRIDLGRFATGTHFAFAAGLGIDASMIAATTHVHKQRLGVLGYVWSATRDAWGLNVFELTAWIDGVAVRTSATLAMVVNAGSLFGGLLDIGPGIVPDDGLLDVCIFSPRTRRDLLLVAGQALTRRHAGSPRATYLKARHVRLESEPARPVQADGELIGTTPVEISVVPGAALVLVPRSW
jgi:YegS/Rv2252/BmrU family lipid kinase